MYFVWRVGGDFHKQFQILEEKKFSILFCVIEFFNVIYYCSKNLKRHSEHSGFRPDTSSLVCFCSDF